MMLRDTPVPVMVGLATPDPGMLEVKLPDGAEGKLDGPDGVARTVPVEKIEPVELAFLVGDNVVVPLLEAFDEAEASPVERTRRLPVE